MKRLSAIVLVTLLVLAGSGCKGEETNETASSQTGPSASAALSPEQLQNGIGPISKVSLGEIDEALVVKGDDIFASKCSACHKFESRYVGPPLGGVLERRTPEYIMNMMLNPEEMVQRHPEAKAMLAQYLTPMPFQSLTEEDARAVLEYLRVESEPVAN